jgi:hypothetical protein
MAAMRSGSGFVVRAYTNVVLPPDMSDAPPAAYTATQRRRLEQAVAASGRQDHAGLLCPACGAALTVTNVAADARISYVRHRVWVVCPSCHRSASVDDAGPGPRGSA